MVFPRLVQWTAALGLFAVSVTISACSGGGLAADSTRTDDDFSRSAADLQTLYDQMGKASRPDDGERAAATVMPPPPSTPKPRVSPMPADLASTQAAPRTPAIDSPPGSPPAPAPTAPETSQQKRDRLLADLAQTLSRRDSGAPDAFSRAVDLMILETIRPGAGEKALSTIRDSLTPPQKETLAALSDLLASMPRDGSKDSSEIVRQIRAAASRLAAAEPLRITTAVLCRRVESFGNYTPFPSNSFLAGRSHAALVYVEVANVTQRPVSSAADFEEFSLDLSQEINLYHGDGVLAWRVAEQPVRQTSRNVRHDSFLCQRIDLPPTLTIGQYNLKVVVRDKNGGGQAQVIIPIKIVADANLTGGALDPGK